MKRISVFCLLILLLLSTCLAACGSTPAATTPAATTPAVTTPAATTPAATTPAVTTPTVNTKEKPVVTVDADGNVRWEPIYGATEYVVRVYNTYEGQTTRVHTYTVEEPSYRIFARDSITVTPKFDTVTGGTCDPVSYMPAELYSFDLVSALANATRTETLSEGDTVYTVALPDGRTVRVVLSGARLEADGTLTLDPNGHVYTLDHVGAVQAAIQTDTLGESSPDVLFLSGYSFDKKSSVESYDELDFMNLITTIDSYVQLGPRESGYFDLSNSSYSNSFRLGALRIEYVPAEPVGIGSIAPDLSYFPTLFDGAPTNYDRLEWDPARGIYDFYFYVKPDAYFYEQSSVGGIEASDKCTVVGLKDGEGKEIPLGTPLREGFVLTVAIGHSTFDVPLPMIESMEIEADHIGDMNPYLRVETEGELSVIVVPLSWSDLPDRKNDTSINYMRRALGVVRERDGNLASYESADGYSLSEYFREVSYGKLTTVSFITDWYDMGVDFASARDTTPNASFLSSLNTWLDENYDLDPAIYDRDGNGLYDAVIFINTGDMTGYNGYVMASYAGGFCGFDSIYRVPEGTEGPVAYRYVTIPLGMLFDSQVIGTGNFTANTLIHEFGHVLGLVDYYSTSSEGSISALGALDMMDKNVGDFNPYSKYALGWIEPELVDEEDFGGESSVTFTLSSYEKTGNCLVIPARGYTANGTAFDEYVTVELLTFEGVTAEATETLSLSGTPGIRVLHVDARLREQHGSAVLGSLRTLLTTVATNSYSGLGKIYGFYLVEAIQADGENDLTDPNQSAFAISDSDLFRAGDTFDASEYPEFFHRGLMDNSMVFGYEITVDSITVVDGEYLATVTVKKK